MKKRIIKFRGKSLLTGEWVYGDLITYGDGAVAIGSMLFDKDRNYEKYVVTLVDESTVGQYVGLRNMEAEEIYEGDILAHRGGRESPIKYYLEVYYDQGLAEYKVEKYDICGKKMYQTLPLASCLFCDNFLYGNIFDNKDFLKL